MSKDISFNIGNFKILKSDINLNSKNFVGYDDNDYDIVSSLNSSNINIATNGSIYIKENLYLGYTEKDIQDKIIIDSKNKDDNKINDSNIKLNVKGDSELNGDLFVSNNFFVKNNCFFNQDIFINNTLNLQEENISDILVINVESNNITLNTYKFLLSNILNNIKENTNKQVFSLKFVNPKNMITQSILSVNKIFIINKNIKLNCCLLVYILYFKNNLIDVKPIMDTFTIIDNNYKLYKIIEDDE